MARRAEVPVELKTDATKARIELERFAATAGGMVRTAWECTNPSCTAGMDTLEPFTRDWVGRPLCVQCREPVERLTLLVVNRER